MFSGPKWKREVVSRGHKFDFIDTREFMDKGFMMRMKYLWLYIIVLKSFLVYISDIFSAITMLTTSNWSNEIFKQCANISGCVFIPFNIGKWLFVGCIIFSFLLLAYESRKAKKIIASRDISYAFTNVMANNYYSLRSYDHFCFFDHISNSTKTSDDFAFFVFFVFKSWKRLILADTPRQTINALTLYAVWLIKKDGPGPWYNVSKYFKGNSLSTSALTVTTFFTVVVCAGSLLLLLVAAICYFPLLCHIQGNLKEYCCHKLDKRILGIIKQKKRDREIAAAKVAQKEAKGDFSHLMNKKGELTAQPLPQPTLPSLSVDDEEDYQDSFYYKGDKGPILEYRPPMPDYNPYFHAPSSATLYSAYDDNINLAAAAAPIAGGPIDRRGSPHGPPYDLPHGGNYVTHDAHDVYQGRIGSAPPSSVGQPQVSIAYDDVPGYQRGNYVAHDAHDVYQGRIGSAPPSSVGQPQVSIAYDDVPGYQLDPYGGSRGWNRDVEGGVAHAL